MLTPRKVRLMKQCSYEEKIDLYVLDKLGDEDRKAFEEHYFNCMSCFSRASERDEILNIIRRNPSLVAVKSEAPGETRDPSRLRLWLASFKPREWALAGLAACVGMVVLALLLTRPPETPVFLLEDDETVRGHTLSLISPVIDIAGTPAFFEWRSIGENVTYDLTLFHIEPLWKTTTRESRVSLPGEIRSQLIPGQSYSWQVKAYSEQGTLIAVSSRVRFTPRSEN